MTRKTLLGWVINTTRQTLKLPPHQILELAKLLDGLCRARCITQKRHVAVHRRRNANPGRDGGQGGCALRDLGRHSRLSWRVLDLWQFRLTRIEKPLRRSPREAFLLKCDAETNPPERVDAGECECRIKYAPAVPMELPLYQSQMKREREWCKSWWSWWSS